MTNIYHFSSQAICDKFFVDLFESIGLNSNFIQHIYVPYDKKKYNIPNIVLPKVQFTFAAIKKFSDRLLYFKKVKKYASHFISLHKDTIQSHNSVLHAHSLFTDGGPAYQISLKYNIPLVVSIRTTDVHYYFKYYKHTLPFVKKILKHATRIIFITENIKKSLYGYLDEQMIIDIENKSVVITNGVNKFWIDNIKTTMKRDLTFIKLVQVSRLTKIKNVKFTINVVKKMLDKNINVELIVIGDGPEKRKLNKIIQKYNLYKNVKLLGYVQDKGLLLKNLQNSNIFILPSISETFGIAYFEALTQGLPILYTINQGIYGLVDEGTVGFGINIKSIDDAISKICYIFENYNTFSVQTTKLVQNYSWNEISKKYVRLYMHMIGEKNES